MSNRDGNKTWHARLGLAALALVAIVAAMLVTVVLPAPEVGAQGPPYNGPQTGATGPAHFGPAPNPVPYCDSATYFDPFPENTDPIGRIDVTGAPNASVTTSGITMDFELTAEGAPGSQYPGFFPFALTNDGGPNDQPKGVEMAANDAATVTLSKPLFYSQWVFTDVDRENEGFFVTPAWTQPGEIAIFGGDANFEFDGSSNTQAAFADTDTVGLDSEDIGGRVQVDMLGAVTGISMLRDDGSGQSGFAVGGGCEAAGAAKRLVDGPTWNGSSFDVTFELRIRNNLPSGATVSAAILAAQANAASDFLSAAPSGIALEGLQLTEDLADPAFSDITVTNLSNGSLPLNPNFDGLVDTSVLQAGATLEAESNEVITLDVQYTPDLEQPDWNDCAAGYTYSNQATVSATAANVDVSDDSDDGINPEPNNDNGAGGVDDSTLVNFPCPPAGIDIVKTAVVGPAGTCPDFAGGVVGDGPELDIIDGGTVTYCISVSNPETFNATNVVVSDPQNPNGDVTLGTIAGGAEQTISYDLQVDGNSPRINTATVTGSGPDGPLPPASDTAVIRIELLPLPTLEIVKTVIVGPNGTCPSFADGLDGIGAALVIDEGDTVTYCLSVHNAGPGDATNVIIGDPQAPATFDGTIGPLAAGDTADASFDLTVSLLTPTANTATVTGDGPYGPVPADSDDSLILRLPIPDPALSIVKTVIAGPNGVCPAFDDGVPGAGEKLTVTYGETVTYCISVENASGSPATKVIITDAQAPAGFDGFIGDLGVQESVTRSYDIEVDGDTPRLNTAFVNGEGHNGPVPTGFDQALIEPLPKPDPVLQIVKTVVPGPAGTCPATLADGEDGIGVPLRVFYTDTVTYCITVRNDDGTAATGVIITDRQAPDGFDGDVGDLAVGTEATRSFDLVVDAATPPINTASVGGSGPNGPVPDDSDQARINADPFPDPALEIVKTVVPGPDGVCPAFADGIAGLGDPLPVTYTDTVTYCISVFNREGSTANEVVIDDDQAPASFDGRIGVLAVGEEQTRSFDVVVDITTPDINTATATGAGPNGEVPAVTDQARIDPDPLDDPVLEIVKTVLLGPAAVCPDFDEGIDGLGTPLSVLHGETVTYCISVYNSSGSTASDVTIDDPMAPATFDGDVGVLDVGDQVTRSFDLVINADSDQVNTASAMGEGPNGRLPVVVDQARIIPVRHPDPRLDIVKTVVPGPNGTCPSYEQGVQGVGDALRILYESTVTYCLSVLNSGRHVATQVVITDVQAPADFNGVVGDLGIESEVTLSFDKVVETTTPVLNTGRVDGEGPNGSLPADIDQAEIDPFDAPDPRLAIVKTVVLGPNGTCPTFDDGVPGVGTAVPVVYGETVTYCMSVANDGLGPATHVVIADAQAPASFDGTVGDLDIGAKETRSFDIVVDAGTPPVNTALVSGEGPNGPVPGDSDTAQLAPSPVLEPVLNIVKTVVPGPDGVCPAFVDGTPGAGPPLQVVVGDTVTYCLTVRNNGRGQATNVVVSDPQGDATFDGDVDDLAPNQEATVAFDVVVDDDTPLVNVAGVTGEGPNGEVDPDNDLARIDVEPFPVPNLVVVKTAIPGPSGSCPSFEDGVVGVGTGLDVMITDTVTYCISVRNVGDGPAIDVVINDSQANGEILAGNLDPGATFDTSYDIVVSATTVLVNTAVASGQGLDGSTVTAEDSAQIAPTDQLIPSITLTNTVVSAAKSCSDSVESVDEFVLGSLGDEVRWCFEITNTGNTALTDIVFDDLPIGLSQIDVLADHGAGGLSLPAGASIVFTSDAAIPDLGVISLASVVGTPSTVDGIPLDGLAQVSDNNDAEVAEAAVTIEKVVVAGADGDCAAAVEIMNVNAGDSVTWCFTVTNTGGIDLRVPEITDTVLGITVAIPEAEQVLTPGSSVSASVSTAVTEDTENQVDVVGQPLDPDGEPYPDIEVTDRDIATVQVLQADLSIVKTVSDAGPVDQGAELTYTLTVENSGPDEALGVVVDDRLPDGLSYASLPELDGWTCSTVDDAGTEGFSCTKETPMAASEQITLTYLVDVDATAALNRTYENQATVTSTTPDPDPTNNEDITTTKTRVPTTLTPSADPIEPVVTQPEPDEPDEVLELVITGSSTSVMIAIAMGIFMVGGAMQVASRRRETNELSKEELSERIQ